MKASIRKWLFASQTLEPFKGISLSPDKVEERVWLTSEQHTIDVTNAHAIFCQSPFTIGVWNTERKTLDQNLSLLIKLSNKIIAKCKLEFEKEIVLAGCFLTLFTVEKGCVSQSNILRRNLILLFIFLKNKERHSFADVKKFAALYSFPRKVVLTTFTGKEHFNIFPMDFQGNFKEKGIYFLGLRHSNITLKQIINEKHVVVCDVDASERAIMYRLGKHHSSRPPFEEESELTGQRSRHLDFKIPQFATHYWELELLHFYDLGSHMLLIGKVMHEESLQPRSNHLHHIHCIHALEANYQKEIFRIFSNRHDGKNNSF